jgi:serine/threonine-protein kinase HipA
MIFQPISLVHVYFMRGGDKCRMGRLLLKDRKLFFEYDFDFLNTGLELSPLKLPLKRAVIESTDRTFDGLFGVFNDSLPDGWGRLLLDRQLRKSGLNPNILSPLDRLYFVGSNGMGALIYEPENQVGHLLLHKNLDESALLPISSPSWDISSFEGARKANCVQQSPRRVVA